MCLPSKRIWITLPGELCRKHIVTIQENVIDKIYCYIII